MSALSAHSAGKGLRKNTTILEIRNSTQAAAINMKTERILCFEINYLMFRMLLHTRRSVVVFVAAAGVLFLVKLGWPKRNSFYDLV